MKSLVDSYIEKLNPYVPGKPVEELERELGITGSIKLASNENPLGPSPKAVEAMMQWASRAHIYPDAAAHNLKAALAEYHQVTPKEIIAGNGSNELLTLAVRTFCCAARDRGVISDYSFVVYAIIMQAHNIGFTRVPMQAGLVHDLEAMAEAVTPETKIVFVANPNNPTGTYVGREALRTFLRTVPEEVVVVIDEAYHDYVQAEDYSSAEDLRGERERLILCRTFSKCYGLAGVRVGYALASPEMIDMMNRVREPFNCNLLGQNAAVAALGDLEFIERSVRVNEEGRARFEKALLAMADRGVTWTPSQTNFLLVRTPFDGSAVNDGLLRRGVIVRPMAGYGLAKDLRITIGTMEEVDRCVTALDEVLSELEQEEASR
ncbi:MAG: histidinol-phosphate transaminase [Bradymonadaceae bacterium]